MAHLFTAKKAVQVSSDYDGMWKDSDERAHTRSQFIAAPSDEQIADYAAHLMIHGGGADMYTPAPKSPPKAPPPGSRPRWNGRAVVETKLQLKEKHPVPEGTFYVDLKVDRQKRLWSADPGPLGLGHTHKYNIVPSLPIPKQRVEKAAASVLPAIVTDERAGLIRKTSTTERAYMHAIRIGLATPRGAPTPASIAARQAELSVRPRPHPGQGSGPHVGPSNMMDWRGTLSDRKAPGYRNITFKKKRARSASPKKSKKDTDDGADPEGNYYLESLRQGSKSGGLDNLEGLDLSNTMPVGKKQGSRRGLGAAGSEKDLNRAGSKRSIRTLGSAISLGGSLGRGVDGMGELKESMRNILGKFQKVSSARGELKNRLPPKALEIAQMGKVLGIDPVYESSMLWIAEQALMFPLPSHISEEVDEASGALYYYNKDTEESSWEHPLEKYFRRLTAKVREGDFTFALLIAQELESMVPTVSDISAALKHARSASGAQGSDPDFDPHFIRLLLDLDQREPGTADKALLTLMGHVPGESFREDALDKATEQKDQERVKSMLMNLLKEPRSNPRNGEIPFSKPRTDIKKKVKKWPNPENFYKKLPENVRTGCRRNAIEDERFSIMAQELCLKQRELENLLNVYNEHKNQDGVLGFSGFRRAMEALLSDSIDFRGAVKTYLDAMIKRLFELYDRMGNNNGKIDFGEFAVNISCFAKGNRDHKIRYTFMTFDQDKKGYVDMNDIKSLMRPLYVFFVAVTDSWGADLDRILEYECHYAQLLAKMGGHMQEGKMKPTMNWAEFHVWSMMDKDTSFLLEGWMDLLDLGGSLMAGSHSSKNAKIGNFMQAAKDQARASKALNLIDLFPKKEDFLDKDDDSALAQMEQKTRQRRADAQMRSRFGADAAGRRAEGKKRAEAMDDDDDRASTDTALDQQKRKDPLAGQKFDVKGGVYEAKFGHVEKHYEMVFETPKRRFHSSGCDQVEICGGYVIASFLDGPICVWDSLDTTKLIHTFGEVRRIQASMVCDPVRIVALLESGGMVIYDLKTGRRRFANTPGRSSWIVKCVALNTMTPDGYEAGNPAFVVGSYYDNVVRYLDPASHKVIKTHIFSNPERESAIHIRVNEDYCTIGTSGGRVVVWEREEKRPLGLYQHKTSGGPVTCLLLHESYVVSAAGDSILIYSILQDGIKLYYEIEAYNEVLDMVWEDPGLFFFYSVNGNGIVRFDMHAKRGNPAYDMTKGIKLDSTGVDGRPVQRPILENLDRRFYMTVNKLAVVIAQKTVRYVCGLTFAKRDVFRMWDVFKGRLVTMRWSKVGNISAIGAEGKELVFSFHNDVVLRHFSAALPFMKNYKVKKAPIIGDNSVFSRSRPGSRVEAVKTEEDMEAELAHYDQMRRDKRDAKVNGGMKSLMRRYAKAIEVVNTKSVRSNTARY